VLAAYILPGTSIYKSLRPGASKFALALAPNTLIQGASYTFKLSGYYSTNGDSSDSQISININAAPSGGVLVISPAEGVALNTSFFWRTFSW
jgi:hypothetical protein